MSRRVTPTLVALVSVVAAWVAAAAVIAPSTILDGATPRVGAAACALVLGAVCSFVPVRALPALAAVGAAVLPLRVPVPLGDGEVAMLLVPLYAVLAVVAAVLIRDEVTRWRRASQVDAPRPIIRRANRLVLIAAAGYVALAAASLGWSADPVATREQLALVLLPFLLTIVVVRALVARSLDLRPPAVAFVGTSVVAAAAGLVQAATATVWWHEGLIAANRFRPDVRTNGILYDPNIYGRLLVVAGVLLAASAISRRTAPSGARRHAIRIWWGAHLAAAALVSVALWYTYSQSSFVALAAAAFILMLLTLPPRARRVAAVVTAVAVVLGAPMGWRSLQGPDTTGRSAVVRGGMQLVDERPVLGWGAGAFESAYVEQVPRDTSRRRTLTASHTTPVTVVAELGLVGLATFLVMFASAVAALALRWKRASTRSSAARALGDPAAGPGWPLPATIWSTGALAAIAAHSLLYAGLFEDPVVWVALALASAIPRTGPNDRPTVDQVASTP